MVSSIIALFPELAVLLRIMTQKYPVNLLSIGIGFRNVLFIVALNSSGDIQLTFHASLFLINVLWLFLKMYRIVNTIYMSLSR